MTTHPPHTSTSEAGETSAAAEAEIMRQYNFGNLTRLGVAKALRKAGFRTDYAVNRANELPKATGEIEWSPVLPAPDATPSTQEPTSGWVSELLKVAERLAEQADHVVLGYTIGKVDIEGAIKELSRVSADYWQYLIHNPAPASPPQPVTGETGWINGEREIFVAWLPKLIAALGAKPAHVDDVERLARLHSLLSSSSSPKPSQGMDDLVERLTKERDGALVEIDRVAGIASHEKNARAVAEAALQSSTATIASMREAEELLELMLDAEDVWTDYGSGFRIHFSFAPGHRSLVVSRLNSYRARRARDNGGAGV